MASSGRSIGSVAKELGLRGGGWSSADIANRTCLRKIVADEEQTTGSSIVTSYAKQSPNLLWQRQFMGPEITDALLPIDAPIAASLAQAMNRWRNEVVFNGQRNALFQMKQ